MRYGRTVDDGFLPVFSVDTENEARALLTMTCSHNQHGEFVARELLLEQTLDNLDAFSLRLGDAHALLMRKWDKKLDDYRDKLAEPAALHPETVALLHLLSKVKWPHTAGRAAEEETGAARDRNAFGGPRPLTAPV